MVECLPSTYKAPTIHAYDPLQTKSLENADFFFKLPWRTLTSNDLNYSKIEFL